MFESLERRNIIDLCIMRPIVLCVFPFLIILAACVSAQPCHCKHFFCLTCRIYLCVPRQRQNNIATLKYISLAVYLDKLSRVGHAPLVVNHRHSALKVLCTFGLFCCPTVQSRKLVNALVNCGIHRRYRNGFAFYTGYSFCRLLCCCRYIVNRRKRGYSLFITEGVYFSC